MIANMKGRGNPSFCLTQNKMDFYAEISKAFICDEDAQPDKTARYYDYIAKH